MKLGKVQIAYPHIFYSVQVSHHTERKSTAMEWMLLEIARATETYSDYGSIPLEQILSAIFSINDSEILLRQVLLDLVDVNALEQIAGLSDTSDWSQIHCGDLRLTESGRQLQREEKLPAKSQNNNLNIIYDVINETVRVAGQKNNTLSEVTKSIKVLDFDEENLPGFPESLIYELLQNLQQKEKNSLSWLQRNSQISAITPFGEPKIRWQNFSRDILADSEGNISLQDESDPEILKTVLKRAELGIIPEGGLPTIPLGELLEKKNAKPYSKAGDIIAEFIGKQEVFFLDDKFFEAVESAGKIDKKICLVSGQAEFGIENSGRNMIVKIPTAPREGLCYQDKERAIYAAAVEVHFEDVTRLIPYVYETSESFEPNLLKFAQDYFRLDSRILKLLDFVKDAPYSEFYTADFLREKLNSPPTEPVTSIDEIINRLLNLRQKLSEDFPYLQGHADCWEIRRALLEKGSDALNDIRALIIQWLGATDSLQKKTGMDLNSVEWRYCSFGEFLAQMNRISEAVELFFEDAADSYNKAYIVETSALMHFPYVLDALANKKALVVIPNSVIETLEKLEDSEEEKVQSAARRAFQKLEEYSDAPWLNCEEENYAELFSESPPNENFLTLSLALKYLVKNPVLVTDDSDFQEFAAARGIESATAHALHEKFGGSAGKTKGKSKKRRKQEGFA